VTGASDRGIKDAEDIINTGANQSSMRERWKSMNIGNWGHPNRSLADLINVPRGNTVKEIQ